MWFLIKGSVWFALVLIVLSFFSSRPAVEMEGTSQHQMQDAVSAAAQAYQYLSAICLEKPDVCVKGAETFSSLGQRAREGARVAFELLDNQFADEGAKAAKTVEPQPMPQGKITTDTIATGTVATGAIPLPLKRPDHP